MFDHYANISESDMATKLKTSFNNVVRQLNNLQDQGLISYLPQTDQPQMQFILARVDLLHLDTDVKYIELRKKIQSEQIRAVLDYADTFVCRSIQLLSYFDEPNADQCGVCDVCLAQKRNEDLAELDDKIDFEIATLVQTEPRTLDELINQIRTGTDQDKLNRIRELLDAGKIKTDGKNYYL